MANPYTSYYDQSYNYENHAGPSTYPYQYQQYQYHTPYSASSTPYSVPPSSWQNSPSQPEFHSPFHQQISSQVPLESDREAAPSGASQSPPVSPSRIETPATWAIWSRRPTDPHLAVGLVFSSRIRPPDHIVKAALDIRTPPQSPIAETASLPDDETPVPESEEDADAGKEVPVPISVAPASTSASTYVPSSASTEDTSTTTTATPSTTLPGSPASSTTSISVSASNSKDSSVSVETKTNDTPVSASNDTVEPSATTVTSASSSTDVTTAPQSPPPLKKSWASLLRPANSSSPSSGGASDTSRSRPKIPTSSVVGFSIPADAPSSSSTQENVSRGQLIPPAKRAEFLALLNSDFSNLFESPSFSSSPSSSGMSYAALASVAKDDPKTKTFASSPTKVTTAEIHPRGLINTGNMCFANSVLQLLSYSEPFFRVFYGLTRFGWGIEANNSNLNVKETLGVETPLVDATCGFLTEFLPEQKENERDRVTSSSNVLSASSSSSKAASTSGSNKGKGKSSPEPEDPSSSADTDPFCPFIPASIYDALKTKKQFSMMRWGQQEDAEEFLGFYLEGLEEELEEVVKASGVTGSQSQSQGKGASTQTHGRGGGKKATGKQEQEAEVEEVEEDLPPESEQDGWMEVGKRNRTVVTRTIKSTDSPITRMFGGKFRTSLRVPGLKESAIIEDWRSLRLDIQRDTIHTIQDALSNISSPQTINLNDSTREGSQQILIEALPPVLVIHLKRFEYDTTVGGVVKVGKQISFGPELMVGTDVLSVKARSSLSGTAKGIKYKLFGVIYHHGISASGGHYTLDVLHPDRYPHAATAKPREGWIRIDDELVSDVRPEDVFGQGEFDAGSGMMRCAYLLFYRRMR